MKVSDVKSKTNIELLGMVRDLKKALMSLRFQKISGELKDVSVFKNKRKEIAVINTVLSERKKNGVKNA